MRQTILLVLALFVVAPAAGAEVFYVAPEQVRAEGDGTFRFTVLLIADENCLGWSGFGYGGVDNVDGGMWADTFCVTLHEFVAGQHVSFEVTGRLVDPTRPGIVWSSSAFCIGGGGEAETVVLAPAVDNDDESWSALKARYS